MAQWALFRSTGNASGALTRFILSGQPQHVILRGNNRTKIFCAEADYRFCLDKLRLACEKHGCDIHAYALMTNHVHLLFTPQEQSLGKALQMQGRYYVQFFNHRPARWHLVGRALQSHID